MKPDSDGFSTVVPTYNRAQYLPDLLQSLNIAAQQYDGPCEVLIIDDSDPAEAATTAEICRRFDARYIPGPASVRVKRNMGVEQARYPHILFVDSDVTAAPDLYQRHAATLLPADAAVVGSVGVTRFVGADSWMWATISRTQFLNAFDFAERMPNPPWATCSNTAYRRQALLDIGLFDTTFPFRLGGDDADLGLRLVKAGFRLASAPAAVVFHTRATWDSFTAVGRRALRWGRMDLHLYFRKHRERVALGPPKFWHIFLLLAAVGAVQAAALGSPWSILWPVLWAVLALLLMGVATVRLKRESWRFLPNEIAADVLGLIFEAGLILEGLRHGQLAVLYQGVQRGPVLPLFAQQEWLAQGWSMWLAVVVVMLIQLGWL